MEKSKYSERDICSKLVTLAILEAGWDLQTQMAEEKTLTDGRIIVRGKMVTRGKQRRGYLELAERDIKPEALNFAHVEDAPNQTFASDTFGKGHCKLL